MSASLPTATVVIPTRGRVASLRRTLASVVPQLDDDATVVVVDDAEAPGDAVPDDALAPRVRVVRSMGRGLGAARNLGIATAASDLVVFCDDDVTVSDGWLAHYRRAFAADRELVAAGGPVLPSWEAPPPQWIARYVADPSAMGVFALLPAPPDDRRGVGVGFHGCNMAFRAGWLRAHPFAPEMVGGVTIGSGDTGMLRALRQAGAVTALLRGAVVHHHLGAARLHIGYFRRWARHWGGTMAYEELRQRRAGRAAALRYAAGVLAREGWRIATGLAVAWGRTPELVNRYVRAWAIVEKVRYALLAHRPPRRDALREAL